jgi:hypothetical protein
MIDAKVRRPRDILRRYYHRALATPGVIEEDTT